MLIGWTFLRMPLRVPLSTLSPAQNPFEREEVRLGRVELRQEPRPVLLDEALEEGRWEVARVLREQRALHPFDHRVARRQDMRIDHQAHIRIAEPAAVKNSCVPLRRLNRANSAPFAEGAAKRLS